MRRNSVVLCFIFALLFVSGRDANAFIKYLGELSGPGPFVGAEFIFPWSLSHPTLNVDTWNYNQGTLKQLGLENVYRYENTLDAFLLNDAQLNEYAEVLDATDEEKEQLRAIGKKRTPQERVESFVVAIRANKKLLDAASGTKYELLISKTLDERASPDEVKEKAQAVFELATLETLQDRSDDLRDRIRTYGASPVGFLTSMNAIPAINDPNGKKNTVGNYFFTLSTSVFVSLRNDLPYAPDNTSNKRTYWFIAYPSLEYRFWSGNDRQNFFVSGGPGIHFFVGEAFENFSRISLRGRFGFRYRRIYFGLEGDWFAPPFQNSEFGALPGLNSLDRFNVGFFFGVGVGRTLNEG